MDRQDHEATLTWCEEHRTFHQARERSVPCRICSRETWAFHAVHDECARKERVDRAS